MIHPANTRDATYVMANLRPDDRHEVLCQLRHDNLTALGMAMMQTPYAWVAYHEGTPAAFFGATPASSTGVTAWGLGTTKLRHVIRSVTLFCNGPVKQQLIKDGYRWAEARAPVSNRAAGRWIKRLGGRHGMILPDYGNDGEDFIMYRWRNNGV